MLITKENFAFVRDELFTIEDRRIFLLDKVVVNELFDTTSIDGFDNWIEGNLSLDWNGLDDSLKEELDNTLDNTFFKELSSGINVLIQWIGPTS